MPQVNDPVIPDKPAAPGQTNAHRQDTPNDPMKEMKITFGGDQLTWVRFAAKVCCQSLLPKFAAKVCCQSLLFGAKDYLQDPTRYMTVLNIAHPLS